MSKFILGALISNLEFSLKEKTRLVNQMQVDSHNKEIFLNYGINDPKLNNLSKKLKIRGQSRGRPAYKKIVLNKLIEILSEGSHQEDFNDFLNTYRYAVSDYIEKKQKNLDKLMREIKCESDSLPSDTILRIIFENSNQYKVSLPVIKEFYELWIFERVKNIDEYLMLSIKDEPTQEDEDPIGDSIHEIEETDALEELMDENRFPDGLPDHYSATTKDSQKRLKAFLGYNTMQIKSLFRKSDTKEYVPNIKIVSKGNTLKGLSTIYNNSAWRHQAYLHSIMGTIGDIGTLTDDYFGRSFEILSLNAYKTNNKKDIFSRKSLLDLITEDPAINSSLDQIKKGQSKEKKKKEYHVKQARFINDHLMRWKYIKNDLKKWSSKNHEDKQTIINVIFSLSSILNSTAPIHLAIRLVSELENQFKELLRAEKKEPQEDSIDNEHRAPDKVKEKTSLPETNKQKQKKQPSAQILLEDFKKELSKLSAKKELNWLTKNLIKEIFKNWAHEHLLTGNDSPKLIKDIKESNLHACDQLNKYIQHQEQKIKTREEIDKLESNLSSEPTSRKKEREGVRVLKKQLADHDDAIDEIENSFSEIASPTKSHPEQVVMTETAENEEIKPEQKKIKDQEIQIIKTLTKNHDERNIQSKVSTQKKATSTKKLLPATVGILDKTIAQQFIDIDSSDSYRDKESQLNLFWLLIYKGHSNFAYWFIKSLDDCNLRHQDTPPPSLVKIFALSDKINNKNSREASEYYKAIQYLNEDELKSLVQTGPDSGLGIRCLMVASMIQPCFYIQTFPPLFLRITNCSFPDWLRDFINDISTFCKKPPDLSFILSTKSNDKLIDPACLKKIQENIKCIQKIPHERGFKYWKRPAQKLLSKDPIKSMINAIQKNDVTKANDIAKVLNHYNSDESLRELLQHTQKEITREHKSSHHPTKKIIGNPVKEFIDFFNDLFINAKKWTEICFYKKTQLRDPERKKIDDFITSLRTKIPMVRKKIKTLTKENFIASHAGVQSLENCLESLEKLFNSDKPILYNDFIQWFAFPKSLDRANSQNEIPSLALRLAKIIKSNFNLQEELDDAIEHGEFSRSMKIFEELSHSESTKTVEIYESKIKNGITNLRSDFINKIDQIQRDLRDAYMQTIVNEYKYNSLTLELEIAQDQVDSDEYHDFTVTEAKLDEIETELLNLKSFRANELEIEYKNIASQHHKDNTPPKEWTEDVEAALATKNIYVAEEMINSYRESVDSFKTFSYEKINREKSTFQKFLRNENDIYDFFSNKKPGREIINNIKNNIQYGPLIFSKPIGDTTEALSGWNGLTSHQRGTGISKSEKSHLLNILESIGFSAVNIISDQAFNKTLLINSQTTITLGTSPFPYFGSLSEGKYIIALSWKKSLTEIFHTLDSANLDYNIQPLILFLFDDLKPSERIDYWKYCHENSLSILLIDRIIFLFLLSLEDSTTVSRLNHTFETLLPFTFNNPYEEDGPPPPIEMVFGRKKDIRSVMDPRGAAILFGGRQLGKSTILTAARERFHNPELNKFAIAGDKLDENLKDFKGNLRNQKVDDEFWNNIGKAFAAADLLPAGQSYTSQTIRDLLMNNKNLKILITLDEVDTFLDLDFQNDFHICSYLRDLTHTTNHRFKVVMAGLANVQRYARIPNFPLTQLGKVLPIGMMDIEDAMALIEKPLKNAGYFIDTGAAYQILAYTNRHPGLIQVFCHNLVKMISKKITHEHIKTLGYTVNEMDIRNVYKDKIVQEYVIGRFRMTLNLDPSWATLTYGLCIYGMEKAEFSTTEAKDIGEFFWPQGFSTKSLSIINTILSEMVSLGILIKLENMYRLRSHNLKHLLGTQEEMEDELQKVLEGFEDKVPEYRHRSYKFNERKLFSPLTLADEMALLGYSDDNTSAATNEPKRNYSVTSVFGSEALGFDNLSQALNTLEEFEGTRKTYTKLFIKECLTFNDYAEEINKKLKAHKKEPSILIIDMPKTPIGPEIYTQILNFLSGLRKITRPENTRLICLFGPEASWKWLGMSNYISHEGENVTLSLNRWGRNNIKNALTTLGFNMNNSNIDLIKSRSGGWLSLISEFLKINAGGVDEPSKVKGINRILPLAPNQKYSRTQLEKQGLLKLPFMEPILRKLIVYNFDNEVSSENIELISEEIINENPEFDPSFFSNPNRILNWFLRMGMLEPSGSNEKQGCYKVENLTRVFLKELEKKPVKN
jgi:hypothetical protein